MKTVTLVEELRNFLISFQNGSMDDSRGNNVDTVILTIIGAILWKANWEIEVYDEGLGRSNKWLSFYTVNGKYILSFDTAVSQYPAEHHFEVTVDDGRRDMGGLTGMLRDPHFFVDPWIVVRHVGLALPSLLLELPVKPPSRIAAFRDINEPLSLVG